jgi:glutamate/aspartate transport system permease protein
MTGTVDWSILWTPPISGALIDALILTCEISFVSWILSMILGLLIGVMRESPWLAARVFASAYVEVFRNIPLLVQLFFIYFLVPRILPKSIANIMFDFGWEIVAAVVTLSLYSSAKVAEHVRSGYNTIGLKLRQAAASSGLSWWQVQRHVLLGLLLRTIAPSLTSEFVTIFKGSSLAMVVGVMETTYVTRQIGTETFQWLPTNIYATTVYLVCAWLIAGLMLVIEKKVQIAGRIGS